MRSDPTTTLCLSTATVIVFVSIINPYRSTIPFVCLLLAIPLLLPDVIVCSNLEESSCNNFQNSSGNTAGFPCPFSLSIASRLKCLLQVSCLLKLATIKTLAHKLGLIGARCSMTGINLHRILGGWKGFEPPNPKFLRQYLLNCSICRQLTQIRSGQSGACPCCT